MRYLRELERDKLEGKRCLLRLNLDIKNPEKDNLRLNASIPTINFLLDKGAKALIISHRGRPRGKEKELSLAPLIDRLSDKVGQKLAWLENLRFDQREQENDDNFAKELASQADFYVNDDFATSHRANASIAAVTKFIPAYAGLLLEKEIKILGEARDNPKRPLVVIIGGSKIDDKLGVINNLTNKADYFIMGSAYLRISDLSSRVDNFNKVVLPIDWSGDQFDIGPETIKKYQGIIKEAKTIIWNGPVGKFEDERFVFGSIAVARAIIESGAFSIVGGGDTNDFINSYQLTDNFNFISTGGGAMLDFLAGKELPGLKALEDNKLNL